MQYNIQNDAITLTTLKYSATVIVHIYRFSNKMMPYGHCDESWFCLLIIYQVYK